MTSSPDFSQGALVLPNATLRYDIRAGKGPGLVFLPGWCCLRRDWDQIVADLREYPAILVDLPGQGESSSGQAHWSMAEIGLAVAELVRAVGWDQVVVIGHSMGGAVAVETARALRGAAHQVICVDSLTYESYYARQDEPFIREALAPYEADFPAAMLATVQALFIDDSNPRLIKRIADEMASNPIPESLAGQRTLLEWDRDAALADCPAPISVLSAQAFLAPEVAKKLSAHVSITPVDLGGHFFLREQPAATAKAISNLITTPHR